MSSPKACAGWFDRRNTWMSSRRNLVFFSYHIFMQRVKFVPFNYILKIEVTTSYITKRFGLLISKIIL